jgi:4-hydroxybenzoate polyprenyltransferase
VANRWWVYQRERFPILGHGLLIAAFSLSAVSYSAILRGGDARPTGLAGGTAFVSCFLFFLQLRIADEFKDFEEDARYRAYRPVPRGLVRLRELAAVAVLAAAIQLALALLLDARLAVLLGGVWVYLALMSKEFFVGGWLRPRPVLYLVSHMVIVPLIDLYATACDWLPARGAAPSGLAWFLAASYCNGVVLELGRKIRAPENEEHGVKTYSVLWGRRNAVLAWLAALSLTGLCAWQAAERINFSLPAGAVLLTLWVIGTGVSWAFLHVPRPRRARRIETVSGVWTLLMYLFLGLVPLCLRN